MNKRTLLGTMLATLALGVSFGGVPLAHAADQTVRVGIMSGEDEDVWRVVAANAAKHGITVKVTTFSEYTQPNEALSSHDLDANSFQHKPYLDAQIKARGYKIVAAGFTIVEPIGLYSATHKSLGELPDGAKIGIPNDPSNGGRALNLLAANGLLTLKTGKGLLPTTLDIATNPKKLEITEVDAAHLPKFLADLDGAVINTNYALGAGLDPRKDALAQESRTGNPYRNFVAVRGADKEKPWVKTLVDAYESKDVADFLVERFKGAVLPAW